MTPPVAWFKRVNDAGTVRAYVHVILVRLGGRLLTVNTVQSTKFATPQTISLARTAARLAR